MHVSESVKPRSRNFECVQNRPETFLDDFFRSERATTLVYEEQTRRPIFQIRLKHSRESFGDGKVCFTSGVFGCLNCSIPGSLSNVEEFVLQVNIFGPKPEHFPGA